METRVTGDFGGAPVQGYIDVLDVTGDADYRVQVGRAPRALGRARLQTLTKTKTVQLHIQTVIDADRRRAITLYPDRRRGMRSRL